MPGRDDLVLVGRVARAHGHRGEVIVNPETDFAAERFRPGQVLQVVRGAGIAPMEITAARFHQGRPVIALRGVETMNDAEALAGAELRVPEGALAALPADAFYRHDLVGCEVTTVEGERLGTVTAVEGPSTGSRLVVRGPRGEVLVPLAASICVAIDAPRRRIVVDPPEGLLELNE
jgi:16S rRNA processing protein RimM